MEAIVHDLFTLLQEYMPHLLQELHDEYEREQAKGGGLDLVELAKKYEDKGKLALYSVACAQVLQVITRGRWIHSFVSQPNTRRTSTC